MRFYITAACSESILILFSKPFIVKDLHVDGISELNIIFPGPFLAAHMHQQQHHLKHIKNSLPNLIGIFHLIIHLINGNVLFLLFDYQEFIRFEVNFNMLFTPNKIAANQTGLRWF